jgi:hypothetical protein
MNEPAVLFLCTHNAGRLKDVRPIRDEIELRVRRLVQQLDVGPAAPGA